MEYDYPEPALVYQCGDCKHIFTAGTLTPEQLTDMYTNYYPRSDFHVEDYQPFHEKNGFLYWFDGEEGHAYRHVPKNVRVLDIGCGYCETLGYHQARGCEAYGAEADENVGKIAERYGLHVDIGLFDSAKYSPDFFDYVTLDAVLSQIVDPLQFLKDVNIVLKPGGKFVAVFPNPKALGRFFFGEYWTEWHLPYIRHIYSRHSIEILAEQSGYEMEKMKSASESSMLLKNWAAYVYLKYMKRVMGEKCPPVSCNGDELHNDMKNSLPGKLFLFLKKIRFFSLSMRLADLFGMGHTNVLILRKK